MLSIRYRKTGKHATLIGTLTLFVADMSRNSTKAHAFALNQILSDFICGNKSLRSNQEFLFPFTLNPDFANAAARSVIGAALFFSGCGF